MKGDYQTNRWGLMGSTSCSGVRASLLWFAALLGSVAVFVFPAVGAAGPDHSHPLPNLEVKKFEFEPAPGIDDRIPHVVIDASGVGSFSLHFDVKNDGRLLAHSSNVRVSMNGSKLDVFRTPNLSPGAHHTYSHRYKLTFHAPGLYQIKVCSDFGDSVDEAKEGDNCGRAITVRVVPRRWSIEIFSLHQLTAEGGNVDTNVGLDAMNFEYDGLAFLAQAGGKLGFIWTATGTVSETFSGDFNGCAASGSGTVSHAPWSIGQPKGWLAITSDLDKYYSVIEDTRATYDLGIQCPNSPVYHLPWTIAPLQTFGSGGRVFRAMSPPAKSLSGGFTVPGSSASYKWYFLADVHKP